MRSGVGAAAESAAQLLQPAGFDIRHSSGEEAGGFDHLRGDDPVSAPVEETGTGEYHRLPPLGRGVEVLFLLHGDMAEVAAQDGTVQGAVKLAPFLAGRRFPFREELLLGKDGQDLVMDIPPLPHPPIGEKVLPAEAAQAVLHLRRLGAIQTAPPESEEGGKIGSGIFECRMHLVCLRLFLCRSLPRVLDAEGCGDDDYLPETPLFPGLDNHPGDPRIEGELRHQPAPLRQAVGMDGPALFLVLRFDRAEFEEDLDPVPDALLGRTVDEWKGVDVAEIEGEHPEDDARQVGAEDFRRRVEGAAEIVLFAVKADADAVLDAAAAAFPLIGAAFRYGSDGKAGRPRAGVVLGDPGQSRIDHIPDSGDGDRGLCNVGRDYYLPGGQGAKDPLLFCVGEAREEGQDCRPFPETPGKEVAGFPDVLLRRHEDQDVAALAPLYKFIDRPDRRLDGGDFPFFFQLRIERLIANLDGIKPPRHLDDGGVSEGLRELLRIDGRGGDDDAEVATTGEDGLQDAENEIDVEAPLVRLVDDDRVVSAKEGIVLRLHEEDPVGHDLKEGVAGGPVVEADLIADRTADLLSHLFGNPPGDGGRRDPPRLSAADQTGEPATRLQAHLRDLGRLPGAGLAGDNDHGMFPDRRHYLLPALHDRQGRGIDDPGETSAAGGRFFHQLGRANQYSTSHKCVRNPPFKNVRREA